MPEAPPFFVPGATPDNLEAVYAEFGRISHRPVPPAGERIYSITFVHDGDEWVATVGETLRGTARRVSGRGRKKVERFSPVEDPATVLAIFSGVPYFVHTNMGMSGVRPAWANPFMAGDIKKVTYFPA